MSLSLVSSRDNYFSHLPLFSDLLKKIPSLASKNTMEILGNEKSYDILAVLMGHESVKGRGKETNRVPTPYTAALAQRRETKTIILTIDMNSDWTAPLKSVESVPVSTTVCSVSAKIERYLTLGH